MASTESALPAGYGGELQTEDVRLDGFAVVRPHGEGDGHHSHDELYQDAEDTKRTSALSDSSVPVEVVLPSEEGFTWRECWRSELKILFKLALPCIAASASTQLISIMNQIFIGHLGVEEFAAAALANTWFSMLWAFMLGASTAMDTLASQAYGGKDYRSLLVWTYTGMIQLTIFCFPLLALLWVSEHIAAVVFEQGYGEVATLVAQFCRMLIPGMWPLAWGLMIMKFMQVQNSMTAPAVVMGLSAVANVGLNFGLVTTDGYAGAPLVVIFCWVVQLVGLVALCIYQQHQAIKRAGLSWSDWLPVSKAALTAAVNPAIMWEFGKLALKGGVMALFEHCAFEVTTAFAGALGVVQTAAHSALLSLCFFFFFSLPLAVSMAGTIRCANLLGAGRPKQAKLAGWLSIILGGGFNAAAGVLIGASRGGVVRMFTSDADVLEAVKEISLLAMFFQMSDGLYGTMQGILTAMGGQLGCLINNAIGFWGGGVLVGYLLTFQAGMGLRGQWIGLLSGNVCAMLLCLLGLLRRNWHHEAVKAFGEFQEAALERAQEGDICQQLQADADQGLISSMDLSDFDKEMCFFIVLPTEDDDKAAIAETAAAFTPPSEGAALADTDMQGMYVPATMRAARASAAHNFCMAPSTMRPSHAPLSTAGIAAAGRAQSFMIMKQRHQAAVMRASNSSIASLNDARLQGTYPAAAPDVNATSNTHNNALYDMPPSTRTSLAEVRIDAPTANTVQPIVPRRKRVTVVITEPVQSAGVKTEAGNEGLEPRASVIRQRLQAAGTTTPAAYSAARLSGMLARGGQLTASGRQSVVGLTKLTASGRQSVAINKDPRLSASFPAKLGPNLIAALQPHPSCQPHEAAAGATAAGAVQPGLSSTEAFGNGSRGSVKARGSFFYDAFRNSSVSLAGMNQGTSRASVAGNAARMAAAISRGGSFAITQQVALPEIPRGITQQVALPEIPRGSAVANSGRLANNSMVQGSVALPALPGSSRYAPAVKLPPALSSVQPAAAVTIPNRAVTSPAKPPATTSTLVQAMKESLPSTSTRGASKPADASLATRTNKNMSLRRVMMKTHMHANVHGDGPSTPASGMLSTEVEEEENEEEGVGEGEGGGEGKGEEDAGRGSIESVGTAVASAPWSGMSSLRASEATQPSMDHTMLALPSMPVAAQHRQEHDGVQLVPLGPIARAANAASSSTQGASPASLRTAGQHAGEGASAQSAVPAPLAAAAHTHAGTSNPAQSHIVLPIDGGTASGTQAQPGAGGVLGSMTAEQLTQLMALLQQELLLKQQQRQ